MVGTGLITVVLVVLGGFDSFQTIAKLAAEHHIRYDEHIPLIVDLGTPSLIALDLVFLALGIRHLPVRLIPYLFIGATLWFNMAASAGDPIGMAMHASAPVFVVTWVEGVRRFISSRTIHARPARRRSPAIRWLLAPVGTLVLWRKMRLWNVETYAAALELERGRQLRKARLRAQYGWGIFGLFWRLRTPLPARLALRLGIDHLDDAPPADPADNPPAAASDEPAQATTGRTPPPARPRPTTPAGPRQRASEGTARGGSKKGNGLELAAEAYQKLVETGQLSHELSLRQAAAQVAPVISRSPRTTQDLLYRLREQHHPALAAPAGRNVTA